MKQLFILGAIIILSTALSGMAKEKIVGGVPINSPGYFVSLVDSSVRSDSSVEYYPVCGGSLIQKDGIFVVLTAAHCVENLTKKLFVTMKASKSGDVNLSTLVPVKAIVVHPAYDNDNIVNDLALLILDETSPLLRDPAITTIPLHATDEVVPGRALTVIGFGNISSYGELFLDQLQSVVLNEVSLAECQSSGDDYESVDERQVCAGSNKQGKKDSCFGDSGGPLILETVSGPELIGIVSWGVDCAQITTPGVYTRPSAFSAWINQQIDLFTSNTVRVFNTAEMKTFSNAYCYFNNPAASDSAVESGLIKEMKALFLLDNASYEASGQAPDPDDLKLPIDACTFNLPSGASVARSVSLKTNREGTGYEYEHILKLGEQFFASSSVLKMEYEISCMKEDETAALLTSVHADNSIEIVLVSEDVSEPVRYQSHDELREALPAGSKEIQGCSFNGSEVNFYASADDKRFFAKLTGPVFSYSYNKFYELSPVRPEEVQEIVITITPDLQNPMAGKMTFTNHTKVDLHSWQLECENLKFAILPQTELKNYGPAFLVFNSAIGSIAKNESLTVEANFAQNPRELGEIRCAINREAAPVSVE
ncbi:MAG: hypothetical protein A2X86_02785 [Bdellovibrionales bacterium GWA2_49_15]|nr:MAG: hypothetical protein A2X86_02785 [Bdellovibrionales bacterium GWA2_49_15]HAZ14135.1 hypothetical protein [Bdellovibrionales bacterium]